MAFVESSAYVPGGIKYLFHYHVTGDGSFRVDEHSYPVEFAILGPEGAEEVGFYDAGVGGEEAEAGEKDREVGVVGGHRGVECV